MDKKAATIYEAMMENLEQIALTSDNILQRAEQSYKMVERSLAELKGYIVDFAFADKQEEIEFFKNTKPKFLKELLYYMEVFQVEAWKSPGGREEEIAHYRLGVHRIDFYLKRYNELYTYYRKGSCTHDEHYFVRGAVSDLITPISVSDMDARFSTVYSFQFAKMQAYEQFGDYLHRCIYNLEHPGSELSDGEKGKSRNRWTDPKSYLIELAYGIHASRSVNYGKADIKQIIAALELAFNITVGNFYRTFYNLRMRKKNRTPYWDAAKQVLEKSMDETDQN